MRLHYKRDGAPEDYKSGCRHRDQNTAVGAGGFFALQGGAERQSYIWQPVEIGSFVDKPMAWPIAARMSAWKAGRQAGYISSVAS